MLMPNSRLIPLAAALLFAAACSPSAPPADAAADASPSPDVAAPADPVASVDPQPSAPTPASGELTTVRNDPAVIHFAGFGPASFGANEEAVRQAWGRPLAGAPDPANGAEGCYYLHPDPRPQNGNGVAFMFEGGQFVRYDVDTPAHVAPGDLTTGMTAADVAARFPGRVESQPHKYDPAGRYLIVAPENGGETRLLFEVDAAGTISEWRIGRLPQVQYVEGCS
jgi:hypothetical protein